MPAAATAAAAAEIAMAGKAGEAYHAAGGRSMLADRFAEHLPLVQGEVVGRGHEAELFFHAVLDEVCGRSTAYERYGTSAALQKCIETWSLFLTNAVGYDLTEEQVKEDLARAGVEADLVPVAAAAVEARRGEAVSALVRHAATISPQYLRDFDWSTRLVLSSDKISGVREARLLLHLQLDSGAPHDRQGDRDVRVELTAEELDTLLEQFAEIEKEMQSLKQT